MGPIGRFTPSRATELALSFWRSVGPIGFKAYNV